MDESDYLELIYDLVNDSSVYGLGNCVRTTKRVSQKLSTGEVDPISAFDRFPGNDTGMKIKWKAGFTGQDLLNILDSSLADGQHCQVEANMNGVLHKKIGIAHVFNAMKLEGKIKLIDTYKGWSKSSWLNQSWHNPEEFLKSFEDFSMSDPALSVYSWKLKS